MRERERAAERERQRDRDRERERKSDREIETERYTQKGDVHLLPTCKAHHTPPPTSFSFMNTFTRGKCGRKSWMTSYLFASVSIVD